MSFIAAPDDATPARALNEVRVLIGTRSPG
jgi:hypothetical protein